MFLASRESLSPTNSALTAWPVLPSPASRTLNFLENYWTHSGAVYGLGFACAGAAGNLGSLCHCVRGFRLAGNAGGCDRSVLRVSGSRAVAVLCADGIGGVSTGQYSALCHWLPGR